MSTSPIARLVPGSPAFNTLNVRTVDIFLQKSPGRPAGDVRGVDAAQFQVVSNGVVIQNGTTGPDGLIRMRIQGGVSTLQVLTGGVAAEYTVTIRDDAIEGVATTAGQQRRLRMLGYQIGHTGPDGNGVDGVDAPSAALDRTILEFQADDGAVQMNSLADATTQPRLTAAAGV
jgi:hypothetical protein